MEFSLHLPNPFKTWAEFYHMVQEQRGSDGAEDTVSLTEVRPTGAIEAGYTTHYTAQRVYMLTYIEQQVAREEHEIKKQQTFSFHELQAILYALDQAPTNLDPAGILQLKIQNMRNNLPDEPIS
jgi:hypothetical protein